MSGAGRNPDAWDKKGKGWELNHNQPGLRMEEMAGNVVAHGFAKDTKEHAADIRVIHAFQLSVSSQKHSPPPTEALMQNYYSQNKNSQKKNSVKHYQYTLNIKQAPYK